MSASVSDGHGSEQPLTWGNVFGSMSGVEFAPSDYERGQRDMLAKCIAAVEATRADAKWPQDVDDAIAALRALLEKGP